MDAVCRQAVPVDSANGAALRSVASGLQRAGATELASAFDAEANGLNRLNNAMLGSDSNEVDAGTSDAQQGASQAQALAQQLGASDCALLAHGSAP